MSSKRSTPATRWSPYLLAGALLLVVLVASGITAQLSASSDAPHSSSMEDAHPTLYSHGDRLRPLVEATGSAQTLNIYGPGGQIIAQVARDGLGGSQKAPHLLADHLGSTRAILDADGNVEARFEYGPHGEAAGAAAAEVRYRYTGHPYDESQRLYQTPARTYDPTTGRFLSVDPQRQDASPYVYAGNNPAGFLDPTGGGKYPFYLFTGFETWQERTRARSHTADAVGSVFGRYDRGKQVALSVDMFNFSEDLFFTRGISSMAEWKPGRYLNNDSVDYSKTYLFIGPDKAADEMGRLWEGVTTFFLRRPEFARELTIINFSGNTRTGEEIKELFQSTGRKPLLVHAGLKTDATRSGGQVVTSFTTDKGNYKPSEFLAHVHDLEKSHFPQLLTAQEETILGVPQDTAVNDIEMIDQDEVTGDLSQGFYHEGEFIQFPNVPAVQTTTPPATTLTGQSDHSTVPGFTDAQWKKFSEPLSPEFVSGLDQILGESWSID